MINLGYGRRRLGAFSIAAVAVGLACASDAFAQQENKSDQIQLEEVIVTATKRSTTLQDTPISITAVSGEDLLKQGIGDFTALAQEIPGVSMRTNGPGQTEFEMRGISSSGGSSPAVGFYLDDVPMTPPSFGLVGKTVVDPSSYDLNRVEVLRGPQGTLYGASSMGGTVKLITNQPDATGFHASGEAILSGTDGGGFNDTENAMLNLPLIDNQLAIRIVGTQAYTSGWIDRIVLNPFPVATDGGLTRGNVLNAPVQADFKNSNWAQLVGGRISALYTPTDRLTVSAVLFDQRVTQGGENNFDSPPGVVNGAEAHYQPFNIPEPYSDQFTMWSLNANYKFDSFDVTSVTSHWNRDARTTQDGTEQLDTYVGLPSYGSVADGGIGPVSWLWYDKTAQFSEELRVASTGDTRFQWLGGLFYSAFYSNSGQNAVVPGAAPLFGDSNLVNLIQPSTIDQKAAFGELSYRVLDGLKVTVGARYFEYTTTLPTIANGVFYTGSEAYETTYAASKADGLDPKFNLSYDVNKDLMVYATAERGFRPGGGNVAPPAPNTPNGEACAAAFAQHEPPLEFKPDTVWSYELGEKYKIGSTFTLDGALYHERWEGVQQAVSLPCGWLYDDNLGTAVVNGGELEAKWLLTSNWLVSGNFGYSHAYFVQATLGEYTGTTVGSGVQDIPLATGSGALTYFFPVKDGWQASVRGSYDWTDGMTEPPIVVHSGELPSHGFANLRATVFNNRWTVAAFVNNLTNKHAELEGGWGIVVPIPDLTRYYTNQPLTAGLDVNVKF